MKTTISKVILSVILFSSSLIAGDYFDKGTGLTFPEKLAGYTLVWEADRAEPRNVYDDPRFGYSIAYTSPSSELTIYAFTGGVDDIQDGVTDKWVKHFFEQALREIRIFQDRGNYQQVRTFPTGEEFSKLCPKFFLGTKLTYTITMEEPEKKVKSYVFCCGVKKQIFKVRVTGKHDAGFEESLAKFLTGFKDQFGANHKAENGTDQAANAPDSKPKGNEKPQSESKAHHQ